MPCSLSAARPSTSSDQFEPVAQPEQAGGSGTMEPLPVQHGEEQPSMPLPTLPIPSRERSSRTSSRRQASSRAGHSSGASEVIHGLDWFQGELLLESDEEPDEEEGGNNDTYPV